MARKVLGVFIPIHPIGKERARTVRGKNGGVHSYTPKKTMVFEQSIRDSVCAVWHEQPLDCAIGVLITAYSLKPKSKPKTILFPGSKPDWENVAKGICDSLNKILWIDDSRIVDGRARKRFCDATHPHEGIHLVVYILGEEDL